MDGSDLKEKITKIVNKLENLEYQILIKISKRFIEFENKHSGELKSVKEFNEEVAKDIYSRQLKLEEEIKGIKQQIKNLEKESKKS